MNFHASGKRAARPVLCSAILFPAPPSACEGDREVGDQCEAGHEHGSFLPASVSSSSFRDEEVPRALGVSIAVQKVEVHRSGCGAARRDANAVAIGDRAMKPEVRPVYLNT